MRRLLVTLRQGYERMIQQYLVDRMDLCHPNTEIAASTVTTRCKPAQLSNSYKTVCSCVFHFTRESASRQVTYLVIFTEILDVKSCKKTLSECTYSLIYIKHDIN